MCIISYGFIISYGILAYQNNKQNMSSLELEARLNNLLSTAQTETADSDIFAPIPEREECPICLIPLPLVECEISFYACCGKSICRGCTWKHMLSDMKMENLIVTRSAPSVGSCRSKIASNH